MLNSAPKDVQTKIASGFSLLLVNHVALLGFQLHSLTVREITKAFKASLTPINQEKKTKVTGFNSMTVLLVVQSFIFYLLHPT